MFSSFKAASCLLISSLSNVKLEESELLGLLYLGALVTDFWIGGLGSRESFYTEFLIKSCLETSSFMNLGVRLDNFFSSCLRTAYSAGNLGVKLTTFTTYAYAYGSFLNLMILSTLAQSLSKV